ncbi:MAG: helix-turn-helix domain-containing protein [Patescibacteria group bacterium]|nr:helix-turn-helix domain-containing protein [Patescibacteria group bacterium]
MVYKNTEIKLNKNYFSVSEAAKMLGVTRVAVIKQIKSGRLSAEKVGHQYMIPAKVIVDIVTNTLTDKLKSEISKGVSRVISDYGETLKMLGKE